MNLQKRIMRHGSLSTALILALAGCASAPDLVAVPKETQLPAFVSGTHIAGRGAVPKPLPTQNPYLAVESAGIVIFDKGAASYLLAGVQPGAPEGLTLRVYHPNPADPEAPLRKDFAVPKEPARLLLTSPQPQAGLEAGALYQIRVEIFDAGEEHLLGVLEQPFRSFVDTSGETVQLSGEIAGG